MYKETRNDTKNENIKKEDKKMCKKRKKEGRILKIK